MSNKCLVHLRSRSDIFKTEKIPSHQSKLSALNSVIDAFQKTLKEISSSQDKPPIEIDILKKSIIKVVDMIQNKINNCGGVYVYKKDPLFTKEDPDTQNLIEFFFNKMHEKNCQILHELEKICVHRNGWGNQKYNLFGDLKQGFFCDINRTETTKNLIKKITQFKIPNLPKKPLHLSAHISNESTNENNNSLNERSEITNAPHAHDEIVINNTKQNIASDTYHDDSFIIDRNDIPKPKLKQKPELITTINMDSSIIETPPINIKSPTTNMIKRYTYNQLKKVLTETNKAGSQGCNKTLLSDRTGNYFVRVNKQENITMEYKNEKKVFNKLLESEDQELKTICSCQEQIGDTEFAHIKNVGSHPIIYIKKSSNKQVTAIEICKLLFNNLKILYRNRLPHNDLHLNNMQIIQTKNNNESDKSSIILEFFDWGNTIEYTKPSDNLIDLDYLLTGGTYIRQFTTYLSETFYGDEKHNPIYKFLMVANFKKDLVDYILEKLRTIYASYKNRLISTYDVKIYNQLINEIIKELDTMILINDTSNYNTSITEEYEPVILNKNLKSSTFSNMSIAGSDHYEPTQYEILNNDMVENFNIETLTLSAKNSVNSKSAQHLVNSKASQYSVISS